MNETTAHPAAPDPASALDDPRVVRAAQEYLALIEAGKRPNRSEFAARYPEIAAALAECLAGLEFVQAVAPELSSPVAGQPLPGDLLHGGTLGDFRLLREAGRGGMGVVYEAEQISLGRRVALKVLPFAATMDPRHLQRFQNEARAAACLHHTNIVPVYGVGSERGVHYYAMQFIDGRTLADLIAELRQGRAGPAALTTPYTAAEGTAPAPAPQAATAPPAGASTQRSARSAEFFRTAARLGAQAAGALEHAHSLGIIHRDIKPANLLLDRRGDVWVTDFGLAQVQSNTKLTLTGDLVGTLRYMSPEQALGRRGPLDHRTDIYSLGVTLYELLTLEPAFPGQDRQELLQRIAFDEPRPPRKGNDAIPAELETIVLKAMAKEPAERYATAKDLADDLERWLRDEPILARRPTAFQRLRKWRRRHSAVVTTATVAAVLALAAALGILGVSYHQLRREQAKTQAKLEIAEESFRRAIELADKVLDVTEKELAAMPHLEPTRQRLATTAQNHLQAFADDDREDPAVRFRAGMASRRIGDLRRVLGKHEEAEQAYARAIVLLDSLADEEPKKREYRRELALAHVSRSALFWELGRMREAAADNQKARDLQTALLGEDADSPKYRFDLSRSHRQHGLLLSKRSTQEAVAAYRESLKLLQGLAEEDARNVEYQKGLIATHGNLAGLVSELGRLDEAEKAHKEVFRLLDALPGDDLDRGGSLLTARLNYGFFLWNKGRTSEAAAAYVLAVKEGESLATRFKHIPEYQDHLAAVYSNRGIFLWKSGKTQEAEEAFQKAVEIQEALGEAYPEVPAYKSHLAGGLNNIAMMVKEWKDPQGARRLLERAINLQQAALKADPRNRHYREWLNNHHINLAPLLERLKEPSREVDRAYERAIASARTLAKDYPEIPEYQSQVGSALNNWARLLMDRGQNEEARKLLEEARTHQEAALKANPESPFYLQFLRNHLDLHSRARGGMSEEEAEDCMRREIAVNEKLAKSFPEVPRHQNELGGLKNDLARLLSDRGELKEAVRLIDEAVAHQRLAVKLNPDIPPYRDFLGKNYFTRAKVLDRARRPQEAVQAFQDCIALRAELVKKHPDRPPYRRALAATHHELSSLLRRLGRFADAEMESRHALDVWRQQAWDFPDIPDFLAEVANELNGLGVLLYDTGRLDEAATALEEAVCTLTQLVEAKPAVRSYRQLLARCLDNTALVLGRQGDLVGRVASHRQAVELLRGLHKEAPKSRDYQDSLATGLMNLGSALYSLGGERRETRRTEAEAVDREALALLEKLHRSEPANLGYRADLALVHNNLGGVLFVAGDRKEAEEHHRESLELYERLAEEAPQVPSYKGEMARTLDGLGIMLDSFGRWEEAEEQFRKSAGVYAALVKDHPETFEFLEGLAKAHYDLAELLDRTFRKAEAENSWRTAVQRYYELAAKAGGKEVYRRRLARSSYELAAWLLKAGRKEEARQTLQRAVPHYEYLAKAHPKERLYLDHLARSQIELADGHRDAGRHPEAERTYRVSLGRLEELVRNFPEAPANAELVTTSCVRLSELLRKQGRLGDAEQVCRRAVAFFEELNADRPGVREYRAEKAHSLELLGDILQDGGRLPDAERAYTAARDQLECLATAFPREPDIQRDLVGTYNWLLNLPRPPEKGQEREEVCRRAAVFFERLHRAYPDEPEVRWQLAAWRYTLGEELRQSGRPGEAAEAYRQAIPVYEKIVAEGTKPRQRYGPAMAHYRLGHVQDEIGRPDDAEKSYTAAREHFRKLVADPAAEAEHHSQYGAVLNDWAMLLIRRKDAPPARQLLEEAVVHQEKALAKDAKNPQYSTFLRNHYENLAETLLQLGLRPQAVEVFGKSIEAHKRLVEILRGRPDSLPQLAAATFDLGHRLGRAGRGKEAEATFREAAVQYRKLAAVPNAAPVYHSKMGATLNDLAMQLMRRKEWKESRELLEEAVTHQKKALAANPKHPTYRRFLINHHANLTDIALRQGDHAGGAKAVERMIQDVPEWWWTYWRAADLLQSCARVAYRDQRLAREERQKQVNAYMERWAALMKEAGKREPDNVEIANALAWFLAMYPEEKFRDPKLAVEVARKVVARAPQRAEFVNTLGVALCRAGDWKAAVPVLNRSVELSKGGDCHDWLFLAMAHWHTGDRPEARKRYEQAVKWLDENKQRLAQLPNGHELPPLRKEVAELLQKDQEPKKEKGPE